MKHLISCDWGTSTFRLRVLDATTGEIIDEVKSDDGIGRVHQDWLQHKQSSKSRIQFYKSRLLKSLRKMHFGVDADSVIIISGMACSSIGFFEMPYRLLPFALKTEMPTWQLLEKDDNLPYPVYIISGFCTHADIMRGEETMLLGINSSTENEIYILPGTHSKHAFIKSGVLTDFKTYVTGELFSVMTQFSILSNSVKAGEDSKAFEAGLAESTSGNLLNQFFKVRTRQILDKTSGVNNYQFLSGLLIGTELKDLRDTSCKIALIGDGVLAQLYAHALDYLGINATVISATDSLIKGHMRILSGIRSAT